MGNAIDISTLSVSAQTVGQAEEQSPEPGTVTVGETAPEEETGTEETGTEEGTGTESETLTVHVFEAEAKSVSGSNAEKRTGKQTTTEVHYDDNGFCTGYEFNASGEWVKKTLPINAR